MNELFADSPPAIAPLQIVEGLLFVASEPVGVPELARVSNLSHAAVDQALAELERLYVGRGIRLQRYGEHVQLVSAPEIAPYAERFLGIQVDTRISNAALEVLAIIAYRQPLTRAQIDAVRGVDSSGVIRALLARSLIAEAGRAEAVGRPILYATTAEFLRQFGLAGLSDLPPIEIPGPPGES